MYFLLFLLSILNLFYFCLNKQYSLAWKRAQNSNEVSSQRVVDDEIVEKVKSSFNSSNMSTEEEVVKLAISGGKRWIPKGIRATKTFLNMTKKRCFHMRASV